MFLALKLARRVNMAKSAVSRYFNKTRQFPLNRASDFANALNIKVEYLLGLPPYDSTIEVEGKVSNTNQEDLNILNSFDNLSPISKLKLPLLGSVSCGVPKFMDEYRESYIELGADIKADFCLRAKGDSMINARIHDGDIVFVRKTDIVENGRIAVVCIDDEALLKRFYYYRDKSMLVLKAENSKYDDILCFNDELDKVYVLGKAVAFQSDVE